MILSELTNGQSGVITKVKGRGAFRKRIIEMGFIKGKKVQVVKNAPLKDPIQYSIMGYEVSLRRNEAKLIEVITEQEAKNLQITGYDGVITEDVLKLGARKKGKNINVALVGNPNSGKTTLFNHASRSHEHVGNYSGVTVDSKEAVFKYKGYDIKIIDLPGTYSLSAYSPEELYVRNYIAENVPDIVVNVLDASNLERNLYLTTQLIDMDIKVIVALNMYDEMAERGDRFQFDELGKMIGIPFVPTVSSKGKGVYQLFDKVINVYADKDKTLRHIHINYGKEIELSIQKVQEKIKKAENFHVTDLFSSRYLSIKLLEKDNTVRSKPLASCNNIEDIVGTAEREIQRLESIFDEDTETIITDAKYGFIAGALKETYTEGVEKRRRKTEIIDTFLTHRVFGIPVFIFFMWLMFQSTFTLGNYPMEWIDSLVVFTGDLVNLYMPPGMLKDLLVNGVIDGVGGVIVFLPNIVLLFFFISLMEDTGYMARAVFIMDKVMHRIGLHGRSFIPLIMGFGCNVPAIMATRTIENRNNRLLTILINPFMSCSARLPVYVLFIAAFFPDNSGTVLFFLYALGVALAVATAMIFKKTIFKGEEIPFVMELPPYRVPTFRSVIRHMWSKAVQYLKKMGGVILVASVIIWALGYFPTENEETRQLQTQIVALQQEKQAMDATADELLPATPAAKKTDSLLHQLRTTQESLRQQNSYIGRLGKAIEPVMAPLGFDWKMSVGLLTGIAAKEIVVSTLGVLYQAPPGEEDEAGSTLAKKLQEQKYNQGPKAGQVVITPLVALSFLIFILVYFPCIAVVAAIKKEAGSWKWALFTMVYSTALAWILSFIVYQTGKFLIL